MGRYGIKSPEEIDMSWSRGLMLVMSEAIAHATYHPESDSDEGNDGGRKATASLFDLGVLNVELIDGGTDKRFEIASVSGGIIEYREV